MKLKNTLALATSALALGISGAQTATSDIVGYETISLNSGFNPVGVRLVQPVLFSGTFDGDDNTSLTDSSADFSTLASNTSYILQITDTDGYNEVFTTSDLVGSTGITTQIANLGDFSSSPYTIRLAETIETVFGTNNSAGLTSTTSASSSDQIWISDGSGGFTQYFFFNLNGTPTLSLVDPLGPIDPSTIALAPDEGLLLVANGGAKDIVISGSVNTSDTATVLSSGFNAVNSIFPAGTTIETAFGTNNSAGLTSTTSASSSDQIWVSDGNGGFTQYFFFNLNGTPTLSLVDPLGPIDPSTVNLDAGFLIVANGGAKTVTQKAPDSISNL